MNGNGELMETDNVIFLCKLRSSYEILMDERNSCRPMLFQHGGRRTSYSARLYKFGRFYALTYTNPVSSVK